MRPHDGASFVAPIVEVSPSPLSNRAASDIYCIAGLTGVMATDNLRRR